MPFYRGMTWQNVTTQRRQGHPRLLPMWRKPEGAGLFRAWCWSIIFRPERVLHRDDAALCASRLSRRFAPTSMSVLGTATRTMSLPRCAPKAPGREMERNLPDNQLRAASPGIRRATAGRTGPATPYACPKRRYPMSEYPKTAEAVAALSPKNSTSPRRAGPSAPARANISTTRSRASMSTSSPASRCSQAATNMNPGAAGPASPSRSSRPM